MSASGQGDRPPTSQAVEYTVRVSTRARRVRLVMRPAGLEVVVPQRFDRRRIPALLQDKRDWIERASAQLQQRREQLAADPPRLPDRVSLPAVSEVWHVEYSLRGRPRDGISSDARGQGARVRECAGYRLVVSGDPRDFDACRRALLRWLSRRAGKELLRRLDELAREHGFDYERVSVRQQRTRWGSCSRQGNISVNARLLLLPLQACDYILLHELCHTEQMDHSPRFWALLQTVDPDYRAHKKLVRDAAKALPSWLDHEPDDSAM